MLIVKQFLEEEKGAGKIKHPPFSPDHNPPDFILFPRLKLASKGKRFDDTFDEAFDFHVKRKLLAKFPGYV
ncbi:hypothetical protein TNCV_2116391 [Trichonephila clavipes]|nr:hypothetical protein TNCV_2116391 [Trichonephila clavipes]